LRRVESVGRGGGGSRVEQKTSDGGNEGSDGGAAGRGKGSELSFREENRI
jgi:hypothetical protein